MVLFCWNPIHYGCTVKRITNTAENTFRTDNALIISWVYRYNCTDIDLPNPHYPSKSTISLPPLSKVRCCRPKKFGRLPEGLLHHHPFQNRTIPSPCTTFLAPLSKGELMLLSFAQPTIEGLSHPTHHPFQNRTIPQKALYPCLPSKKGRWLDGKAQT